MDESESKSSSEPISESSSQKKWTAIEKKMTIREGSIKNI